MSTDASKAPLHPEVTPPPKFPAGIPYIVGNEGAERFSFYGMRAILYVYLTSLYLNFVPETQVAEGVLKDAKAHATAVTHYFMAGVYAFPMIGAILADRLLGKYHTILWVSLLYCAGHGTLAFAGDTEMGVYVGLCLIALGAGGIKPCVSANVGDQFSKENASLVTKVYQIFYFIINFGSFFSTLITPYLYKEYGAELAFGVPGILMGIATIVFWMGRKKFTKVEPKPGGKLGLLDFVVSALLFTPLAALAFFQGSPILPRVIVSVAALVVATVLFLQRQRIQPDTGFLSLLVYSIRHGGIGRKMFEPARKKFGDEAAEGPPAVLKIMLVFSMVSVFWALFDQHSSTWIEQAKHMNLKVTVPYWVFYGFLRPAIVLGAAAGLLALLLWVSNRPLPRTVTRFALIVVAMWGLGMIVAQIANERWSTLDLQASQIASLNPLMVMIIIPLLNFGVYGPLERRGKALKPLTRMTIGMFLAALAFVAVAVVQKRVDAAEAAGAPLSVAWQIIPFFIITIAEVLVSVTGLEFAYTQAPRAMKSTIMGFWLLCVTFGNLLVAVMAPLQKLSLERFFWTFAGLMAAAAVIFSILAYFYKGKTYLQDAPK